MILSLSYFSFANTWPYFRRTLILHFSLSFSLYLSLHIYLSLSTYLSLFLFPSTSFFLSLHAILSLSDFFFFLFRILTLTIQSEWFVNLYDQVLKAGVCFLVVATYFVKITVFSLKFLGEGSYI